MGGRLYDEPSGDFGISHVGDHRLELGVGLGFGDKRFTIEVIHTLEASNKALLECRLDVFSVLDGVAANLGDDAGNLFLIHFSVCQRVHVVSDDIGVSIPNLTSIADEMDEGATSVAFVACFADHFAVDEDGRGEADGFFAHPFNSLKRLDGDAGGVEGRGVGGHMDRLVVGTSRTLITNPTIVKEIAQVF